MRTLRPAAALLPAFLSGLDPPLRQALNLLVELVSEHGAVLYLVGGSVRDLLVRARSVDVDLVMEIDAVSVAQDFAYRTGTTAALHPAFRTATVLVAGHPIDLVTARSESYDHPAALPRVRPADLQADLARRDFTINAMALALSGPVPGQLVDPFDGRVDLTNGVLRTLHERSFEDDPTRAWRAGRYFARLKLRLDPRTERDMRRDGQFLDAVSPARLHHELVRVLHERRAERALRTLDGLGVLRSTFPPLRCGPAEASALRRLQRINLDQSRVAAVAVLGARWTEREARAAVVRLDLDRHERQSLLAMPPLRASAASLVRSDARPSQVVAVLDRIPQMALTAYAARFPRSRGGLLVQRYLGEWRNVRPLVGVPRIAALGIPAGPDLGRVLRALRAARLDGETGSETDETKLVAQFVKAMQAEQSH